MTIAAMIVTADPSITDDLLRLAAAADAEIELVDDPEQARQGWHWPGLVLVGADAAAAFTDPVPDRRPGVVLVAHGDAPPDIYRRAVEVGAQDVAVLPGAEPWLVDALASAAEPAEGWGTTVTVLGAGGGAGSSVLCAALGLAAARSGVSTLLVDGDPLGGGLDVLLGLEDHPGPRWPDFAQRRGRLSAANLHESLPRLGDLAVLSWGRDDKAPVTADAARSLLDAAARGFDLTIVDAPRHHCDLGRAALHAADTTLLLVPAEIRATLAAESLVNDLHDRLTDPRVIVRGPAPGGLRSEVIAEAIGIPVSGTYQRDRRIPTAIEEGALPTTLNRGSLTTLCDRLLPTLNIQHHTLEAAAA